MNDILQWRREHGVPDYVPFPEPEREPVMGIGAYDRQVIDMANVTEWTPDEELPWYEAGELWAMALRGGAAMRRQAWKRNYVVHL